MNILGLLLNFLISTDNTLSFNLNFIKKGGYHGRLCKTLIFFKNFAGRKGLEVAIAHANCADGKKVFSSQTDFSAVLEMHTTHLIKRVITVPILPE